jgi:hypothetical protein
VNVALDALEQDTLMDEHQRPNLTIYWPAFKRRRADQHGKLKIFFGAAAGRPHSILDALVCARKKADGRRGRNAWA